MELIIMIGIIFIVDIHYWI